MARRLPRFAGAIAAVGVLATLLTPAPAAPAAPAAPVQQMSAVRGEGSSYVGEMMQDWESKAQIRGIPVQYQLSSSPQGLNVYNSGTAEFAATEAEFTSLNLQDNVPRGYQYVPDVAGAIAIMYNVEDQAGRKVDYLHLSRPTIAKIFMGYISRWNDPAISADNKGLELPDQPITVVYRSGQSGTTALFYDFIQFTEPDLYRDWASAQGHSLAARILNPEVPGGATFVPNPSGSPNSSEAARHVANVPWTIGYDEFAYPKRFGAPVAWVDNVTGNWVLPFPQNISAALDGARLRPDLSQELSSVYTNGHPQAYPISAYSYLVVQCVTPRAGANNTCAGGYPGGHAETLSAFLELVACDGQVEAANYGYSPLPPHLSQEMIDAISRMTGGPPGRTLTRENCSNPRFDPSYLDSLELPEDPLEGIDCIGSTCDGSGGGGSGSGSGAGGGAGGAGGPGGTGDGTGTGDGSSDELADGALGVDGGSDDTRPAEPVGYNRIGPLSLGMLALITLVLVLAIPPIAGVVVSAVRKRRAAT